MSILRQIFSFSGQKQNNPLADIQGLRNIRLLCMMQPQKKTEEKISVIVVKPKGE